MRAHEILREGRSKIINEATFRKAMESDTKLAIEKHADTGASQWRMFRGVSGNWVNFLYVDPATAERPRKSANTMNYYTLVMDNSPLWSAYPKRSQSLICSETDNVAGAYGAVFVVLPVGDPVIGICPKRDLWKSFDDSLPPNMGVFSLDELNDQIRRLAQKLNIYIPQDDYGAFRAALDEITARFRAAKENDDALYLTLSGWKRLFAVEGDLYKTFETILDPQRNGFELGRLSQMHETREREVWMSGPCYLVRPEVLEAILSGQPVYD